jgi:hypothetical protein
VTLTAPPAAAAMAARLTAPFGRGSDLARLELALGGSPGLIVVGAYDDVIAEHLSRFGSDPVASYAVEAVETVPAGTTLQAQWVSPTATTAVPLPAGMTPGDGAVLPLPAAADATTRLVGVRESAPRPAAAPAVTRYRVTALFGEIARMLWTMAREADRIRAVEPVLRVQRTTTQASGAGLDYLGADLYVPRFPPMPYTVDGDAVALYHLDEPGRMLDAVLTGAGVPAHSGVLGSGTALTSAGAYGGGVRVESGGWATIASATDLDIAAGASFTVEFVIKPDPATGTSTVVSRGDPAGAGWTIGLSGATSTPPFAITGVVRDGAGNTAQVVLGTPLSTATFTHVALALDRAAELVLVSLDGVEAGHTDASALGVVASSDPVVIGSVSPGFAGWVDELRISDIARASFTAMPYAPDANTVALFHFDEALSTPDAVAGFPGHSAHDGTLVAGASVQAVGRFAQGLRLEASDAVSMANSADFDIAASSGFTVECFVRPDAGTADGFVVSRGDPAATGWALSVSGAGANPPLAVTAALGDGTHAVEVLCGASLQTARFTHIAMALDRSAALLRLFIDGTEVGSTDASALGAVSPVAPVLIGQTAPGFVGWVDEVRISSTARPDFAPALGEADDHYRGRLALFRRWLLPTPQNVAAQLNALVPSVGGAVDPFVISDVDDPLERGRRLVRVWPAVLLRGEHIDRDGSMDTTPSGLWSDDVDSFDPIMCGHHHNAAIAYDAPVADPTRDPSLLPPDPTLMQPPVAAALDALVPLLAAAGIGGALHVISGFDQAAADDRSSGRAVVVRVPGADAQRVAAMAHRAGFDYVEHQHDDTVYAACAPGRQLLVGPAADAAQLMAGTPVHLAEGETVDFVFAQTTPSYTQASPDLTVDVDWRTVDGAVGRVTLAPPAAPPFDVCAVTGTTAGEVLVSVDLTRDGHVQTVGVLVVVEPAPLADGDSIGADGTRGVTTDELGAPEAVFDPAYLVDASGGAVTVDAGVSPLMQQATLALLDALTDQLAAQGQPGLELTGGYDASAGTPTLARRGRMLRLRHPSIGNDRLAVLAHLAGFGFVQRVDPDAVVASDLADLAQITIDAPGEDGIEVGSSITLTVHPKPADVAGTARLGWSSGQVLSADDSGVALGAVAPASPDSEKILVQALTPGISWVQATLRDLDASGPYMFTVDFSPTVGSSGPFALPLDDYYLVMNALHLLCPIGVEIRTDAIRAAVVELNPPYASAEVDPSFTYPQFRLHRAAATMRKEPDDG